MKLHRFEKTVWSMAICACVAARAHAAPLGTAFTYQGQVKSGGTPANGTFDFQFRLFDDAGAGVQQGSTVCVDDLAVTNGLFTVSLDFGNVFGNTALWLDIGLRADSTAGNCASGAYTPLTPRQALTGAPFAHFARDADALNGKQGAYYQSAGNLNAGTLSDARLSANVDLLNAAQTFSAVKSFNANINVINDLASIAFPDTSAPNNPMIYMFANDTFNDDRMVIAHSPGYPSWGLQYQDQGDRFRFLEGGTQVMSVNLGSQTVTVGENATAGKFGVTTPSGVGIWAESGGAGLANVALRANNQNPGGIGIFSTTNSLDANLVLTNTGTGDIIRGFSGPGGGNLLFRVLNDGTTVTTVLQITGGADLAEPFRVNESKTADAPAKIEPGMVVAIDPANPGQLKLAAQAYDRKVAGVISGANGLAPGMVMSAKGNASADGDQPVALTGRVWCRCDAHHGAIEPGDLLTTSATPGHAMKVTDFTRSQGAVLGKAMTGLKQDETGLVLVLVSLQ